MMRIRHLRRPRKKQAVSRWLNARIQRATAHDFYLLESIGPPVVWEVNRRSTGHAIAKYWPATGSWLGIGRLSSERGSEQSFGRFFAELADRCGA
jgi:hypothetical protein